LHHYHQEGVQTLPSGVKLHHRKTFVNGIGWEADPYWHWALRIDDINNPARIGAFRGWVWVDSTARTFLGSVLDEVADDPNIDGVILNTVGFSRGAVSAMWFANSVSHNATDYPQIKKINILNFDPVPGWFWDDTRVSPDNFDFSGPAYDEINQYVGMFARDENSGQFWALVPVGIADEDSLMITLPGAHETIVGSKAVLGHSEHNYCCCLGWPQCDATWPTCGWSEIGHDDHPGWVGRLTSLIASQFLRSPEWGAAQFDPTWYHSGTQIGSFSTFQQKFNEYEAGHLPYNYWWMRTVGFTPAVNWPSCLDQLPWGAPYERRAINPDVVGNQYLPVSPNILGVAPLWPYHYTSLQVQTEIQPMLGRPPVANAGFDQTVVAYGGPNALVTLDGSASYDPDGNLLLYYAWDNVGDPGPAFAAGHDLSTLQVWLPVGAHDIQLALYDGYHVAHSNTTITVIPQCPVLYVDDDAPAGGNGLTWATAYNNIQEAMGNICGATEIRVAGGTYHPGTTRYSTFHLVSEVALVGGYRGLAGGGDPDDRNVDGFETILSGEIGTPEPYDNCFRVVTGSGADATAALNGFTVTAGYAFGSPLDCGAGMFNQNGSPMVIDCTFSGNASARGGAGMYNYYYSDPIVIDCVFTGNTGGDLGGGMHSYYYSDPTLVNCVFRGNSAAEGGATQNHTFCNPILINCTFQGNSATGVGGAIHNIGSSNPTVMNSILWGNTPDEFHNVDTSTPAVTTSCIQGGCLGDGNIGELPEHDPLFADTDLRLLPASPCINAGDNSATDLPSADMDGHMRILCNVVDMGAFESGIGDYDCDGDIDLADYAALDGCMTGSNGGPYPSGCEAVDFEYDDDVDLADFASFRTTLTGPQ